MSRFTKTVSLEVTIILHHSEIKANSKQFSFGWEFVFCISTRGPMGHILDTTMRCFRAIIVQLPNKGKFAKLNTNLEKYLYHLMEHFLIIMMRVQYKCFYSSQSCCLEGTHLIFYALKYTYHLILMALKQTNKTNMAQNGHKL